MKMRNLSTKEVNGDYQLHFSMAPFEVSFSPRPERLYRHNLLHHYFRILFQKAKSEKE